MISRTMGRDMGVAFSLATLSTVRIWLPIWTECYHHNYMMKSAVSASYVVGSLLALCTVAVATFSAACALRRFRRRPARIIGELTLVAALCIPLNAFRTVFGGGQYALSRYAISTFLNEGSGVLLLSAAAAGAYGFWRMRSTLARITYAGLLVMLPLFPLNLAHLTWSLAGGHIQELDVVAGPLPETAVRTRVVWVLFDEWDYGLTFDDRPPGLHLPELDKLRSEALFASSVSSPSWQTRVSVPALTTGTLLKSVAEHGRSDAKLTPFAGGAELHWASAPTIFSDARALGFNTSIVGSYLPYCRVLGKDLSTCWWSEAPNLVTSTGSSLAAITLNQIRSIFETQNFSPFGASVLSAGYVGMYEDVLSHADSVLREQETGLVYLHFPIPHPPTIYNASTRIMRERSEGARGYADNLALVDQTVQHLREAMTADGQWTDTTLLLTSDHWYRESSLLHKRRDLRVPFILKLAGDENPVALASPFSNVVTRDLIIRVLRGEIRTNTEAATWLDAASNNREITPERASRAGADQRQ